MISELLHVQMQGIDASHTYDEAASFLSYVFIRFSKGW